MSRSRAGALWVGLLVTSPLMPVVAAAAPTHAAATVSVSDPWIRLPPPAANVAAGYVQLHNGGGPDRLRSASSSAFAEVQIHAMRLDGEVMRMKALPDGLALPAGQTVALQPGGYHLMLLKPKRPLSAGQTVRIKLRFAHGAEQAVDFSVRDGLVAQGVAK
jgi:copper(I)-binding protein